MKKKWLKLLAGACCMTALLEGCSIAEENILQEEAWQEDAYQAEAETEDIAEAGAESGTEDIAKAEMEAEKAAAEQSLLKGESCLVLEDENFLYICGVCQLLKIDKETKESEILWENRELSHERGAYQYSEGQGLLFNDRIYFIEAWMEKGTERRRSISMIHTDGSGYERLEEIESYNSSASILHKKTQMLPDEIQNLIGMEEDVIAIDDEYVYLHSEYHESSKITDRSRDIYERVSLNTGERETLFERESRLGTKYAGYDDALADRVLKNGYLYYVGDEDYKYYFMRRNLANPEVEEKLGEAFFDTKIDRVGGLSSYYEAFYDSKDPDKMLAYVDFKWLCADESFPGAEEINRYLTEGRNWETESIRESLESAEQAEYRICNSYSCRLMEISYFDGKYVSFAREGYDYFGGAHGMPYIDGMTFDLETGKRLYLEDIIGNTEEELKEITARYFEEHINKNPKIYWENALEYIWENTDFTISCYLTEEGILFYFSPYELSSYSEGFQMVTVPYGEFQMKIEINSME